MLPVLVLLLLSIFNVIENRVDSVFKYQTMYFSSIVNLQNVDLAVRPWADFCFYWP